MALRVVFLGSDGIALPMLASLVSQKAVPVDLVAVYTQPDRPVGRGQKVQANAIKTWALERGIPVLQPAKLTDATREELAAFKADLGLVMAYGHILRDDFIATPRLGMVNLHASLLPSLRGASPIQTAVATGEPRTGVSLMRIVRELDAGPVADFEAVAIGARDTALEAEAGIAAACVPLLARNLAELAAGTLDFAEQDREAASFCRKLSKEDAVIDFARSAAACAARINGLFPWPATSIELAGTPVKFGQADTITSLAPHGKAPGTVLGTDAEGLLVAAGDGGILRLLRLQRPGGKMLAATEFLRGHPIPEGAVLPSTPEPALVGAVPFPRPKAKTS